MPHYYHNVPQHKRCRALFVAAYLTSSSINERKTITLCIVDFPDLVVHARIFPVPDFCHCTTFVITISNVCKANNDQPVVQIQTAFFTPSVLHPNGLAQSANKTNSSPLQIKMYALPPLTLAVFAQPVSPVDAGKVRTRGTGPQTTV